MTYEDILRLVKAVAAGRIKGEASHSVLGVSASTFWRWVGEAERRGVRFHKNARGARLDNAKPAAWRIKSYGQYKGVIGK